MKDIDIVDSIKVKGCPFCGKKPKAEKSDDNGFTIKHTGKNHLTMIWDKTFANAVGKWNDIVIQSPHYWLKIPK